MRARLCQQLFPIVRRLTALPHFPEHPEGIFLALAFLLHAQYQTLAENARRPIQCFEA